MAELKSLIKILSKAKLYYDFVNLTSLITNLNDFCIKVCHFHATNDTPTDHHKYPFVTSVFSYIVKVVS